MLLETYGLLHYCIQQEFTSSGLDPLKLCRLELKNKASASLHTISAYRLVSTE